MTANIPPEAPDAFRAAVGSARAEFVFRGRRTPLHPFIFKIFMWAVTFGGLWALVLIAIIVPPLLGHAMAWTMNGQQVIITRSNLGTLSPLPQILLAIVLFTGALAAATFRLAIPPRPWFAVTQDALIVARGPRAERVAWRDLARVTTLLWKGGGVIVLMRRRDAHPSLFSVLFRRAKPIVMKGAPDAQRVEAACKKHVIAAWPEGEPVPRAWHA